MKRYRRNTVKYKGVKVRYSHLFLVENGIEYTTTEIDERNMFQIIKAYAKVFAEKRGVSRAVKKSIRKNITKYLTEGYLKYKASIKAEAPKGDRINWYPKNIIELVVHKLTEE